MDNQTQANPSPAATAGTAGPTIASRLKRTLRKPYYVFRPAQVVRRALLPLHQLRLQGDDDEILLPWGHRLRFRVRDKLGRCYARRGVVDLPVCEVLWRLVDQGEVGLDVGANIGQMTSVLAAALGGGGRVIALEPHPDVFRRLSENAARWSAVPDTAAIELCNQGASSSEGVAELVMKESFELNSGTASMAGGTGESGEIVETIEVPVRPLDAVLAGERVGVVKIDVEGFELEVLRGAEELLEEHRIRDIVFEEFGEPPTPVTSLLEGHGYAIFSVDETLFGPVAAPAQAASERRSTEDPSYLATVDPTRALERLGRRGWSVLEAGRHGRR